MLIEVSVREVSKGFIVSVVVPGIIGDRPGGLAKEDIARTVHQAAFVAGKMVQQMVEESLTSVEPAHD
jgi:hypothetical protein